MHSHLIFSIYENLQSLLFLPFVNTNAQELLSKQQKVTSCQHSNSTSKFHNSFKQRVP